MMESGPSNKSERASEKALGWLLKRIERADDQTVDAVLHKMSESDDRGHVFLELAQLLESSRQRYHTFEELKKSDRERASDSAVSGHLDNEDETSRNTILQREDAGRPTALEYFFLTLLSTDEWREITKAAQDVKDASGTTGALTLQSTIENVFADQPRTKKFIEGVRRATERLGGREARICDVGCGAFPILAITAAITNSQAQITCHEINPLSAKIAQAVVRKLGLDAQIRFIVGDALLTDPPAKESVDMLISETIGPGLLDEQVVKIMQRFTPSLRPDGVSIPSHVRMFASIVPNNNGITRSPDGARQTKYPFVLNTDGREIPVLPHAELHALYSNANIPFPLIPKQIQGSISLPPGLTSKDVALRYYVALTAEITVDIQSGTVLPLYESFPTSPANLGIIRAAPDVVAAPQDSLEIVFAVNTGSDSSVDAHPKIVRR